MPPNHPLYNRGATSAPPNAPPPIHTADVTTNPRSGAHSPEDRGFNLWAWLKSVVGQTTITASIYGVDGMAEMVEMNEIMGTPEYAAADAMFVFVIVAIPTAIMIWRRSAIAAGVLAFIAFMNAFSSFQEVQAGNPYFDGGSVVFNLLFLAVFLRAVWVLWNTGKANA